jgi:hypothetical protein
MLIDRRVSFFIEFNVSARILKKIIFQINSFFTYAFGLGPCSTNNAVGPPFEINANVESLGYRSLGFTTVVFNIQKIKFLTAANNFLFIW